MHNIDKRTSLLHQDVKMQKGFYCYCFSEVLDEMEASHLQQKLQAKKKLVARKNKIGEKLSLRFLTLIDNYFDSKRQM